MSTLSTVKDKVTQLGARVDALVKRVKEAEKASVEPGDVVVKNTMAEYEAVIVEIDKVGEKLDSVDAVVIAGSVARVEAAKAETARVVAAKAASDAARTAAPSVSIAQSAEAKAAWAASAAADAASTAAKAKFNLAPNDAAAEEAYNVAEAAAATARAKANATK